MPDDDRALRAERASSEPSGPTRHSSGVVERVRADAADGYTPRGIPTTISEKYRVVGHGGRDRAGIRRVHAEDEVLDRPVEIAFPDPDVSIEGPVVRRFIASARALSTIHDPHVQAVLDTGRLPDGRPYAVLEELWGQTIPELLAESAGPLPSSHAIPIVAQVLAGLDALHAGGLVARGLGPASIVVSAYDGEEHAKLRGLVSIVAGDEERDAPIVPFTPYVAPEVRRAGAQVDARADVFSAGALLSHLSTGSTAPRPLEAHPRMLRRALERSFTENVDDRFASAAAFTQAVELIVPSEARPAREDLTLPGDPLVADLQYLDLRRRTLHAKRISTHGLEGNACLLATLAVIEAVYLVGGQRAWAQIAERVPAADGLLVVRFPLAQARVGAVPLATLASLLDAADEVIGRGDLSTLPRIGRVLAARSLHRLVPELVPSRGAEAVIASFPYLWARFSREGRGLVVDRDERRARLAIRKQPSASVALTGLVATVLRAGLAAVPGTAPTVSFVASAALGDAEDVLLATW